MSKKKRRKRATAPATIPPLTFDVLTVSFADRSFTWRGRTVHLGTEAECVSIPMLDPLVPHWRTGWYPVMPVPTTEETA